MAITSNFIVLLLVALFTIIIQTSATDDFNPICLTCKYRDEPVCGKNGVTYGNECAMRCLGVELAHVGPCQYG
uniref:Putative kazal type serine protease inhibitor n=1 Tax=Culex tarsalis TaxID=7177 RepID=A0A1Q3EUW7_CULTA